ncbi:amidohydrolase [Alteribacillus bidgolensis]|uniref:5-methylthioadenosine/S-adenosylhomocysteine deaminase n=1 Tax=Alteribacillus bidgolensis TaxID=930129 RepID=A0A1G8C9P3_9BACI|nr:amidohydrolase [Alteribacillus bidgolensis]SDH41993.1 5-methylthioadenosine/S-adenosylhomocysteine deaminase [Alteribacillus bidgolensis]
MDQYVLNHVHIMTTDPINRFQKDMYLVIRNGLIQEIGHTPLPDALKKDLPVINQKGKLLLPGLYNTHAHTPMSLLRGVSDDVPLKTWLGKEIWPREGLLDKRKVQAGTSLALAEMIKSGTVAFLDMYHLHMNEVFKLTMDAGMKAVLSRGMIGLGTKKEQHSKLNEACELAKYWNENGKGRVKGMLFPHAPYTCPPDFLEAVISQAHHHQLPLGTHLAETLEEVNDHKHQYGKSPLHHLHELGFFNKKAILTHVVHVTDEELDLLKDGMITVSHNPMSNAKLGSGTAPIPKMLEKGISVSLGTDSTASNNNLDMFQEMRTAALLQKGVNRNPDIVSTDQILEMGTLQGARSLGFAKHGLLQAGSPADFIMLDMSSLHLQPEDNLISHLIYSASGQDVTDVYVDGKQLMKDKELLTLDEEKIMYEANECFKDLESRFLNKRRKEDN